MKLCPNCNHTLADEAVFCSNCGSSFVATAQAQTQQPVQDNNAYNQNGYNQNDFNQNNYNQQNYYQNQNMSTQIPVNSFDHTAEFSAEDVSEHKVYALITYIYPFLGIIVSALACGKDNSSFLKFHYKQMLKIFILQILSCFFSIIPFLGFIATGVSIIILVVVQLICFFRVAGNKSIEPPIVRNFKFLN